jgi:predicted SnoaL-like aldol condensation-catalyzing enzyme
MTAATITTPADPTLETRRAVAIDFLMKAASGRASNAMREYAAPDFVHHNPYFASDADSLAKAMDENARSNPEKKLDILRTIAEGPLVTVHARVVHRPGDAPAAVVHIFRFDGELIAELWDVGQDQPADSPNAAGMF